ncbi:MAG: DUF302 domain-containing protein [Actinomycetota bacterium]
MNARTISLALASFVAGLLVLGGVLWVTAPSLMMLSDESPYDYEETLAVFEEEADAAGWSILNSHDMQAVVANHGADVPGVTVFDLCSSQYSIEILELDDERIVTPMMPCRVSVYETSDGTTHIARMNSGLVARFFGGTIDEVMQQASAETEVFIERIVG